MTVTKNRLIIMWIPKKLSFWVSDGHIHHCVAQVLTKYMTNAEMVLVLKYLLTLVSQQILVQMKIVFFGLPQLEKDIVLFIINSPGWLILLKYWFYAKSLTALTDSYEFSYFLDTGTTVAAFILLAQLLTELLIFQEVGKNLWIVVEITLR